MINIQFNQLKKHIFRGGLVLLGFSLLLVTSALAASEESYISAGSEHSCALKMDGQVVCWGDDTFGQSSIPAGSGPFSQISAGGWHTCALETDGDVVCWGTNIDWENSVPAGSGPFSQVSAGVGHTCALETDGDVVCWGSNFDGESTVPAGNGPFSQVSAGAYHTCALETDGDAICWGDDRSVQVSGMFPGSGPFSQISAGQIHSCGLQTDGSIHCWGRDINEPTFYFSPDGVGPFSQVSVGFSLVCAVETDADLLCWRRNKTTFTPIPSGVGPFSQVSVGGSFGGGYHVCALEAGGDVVCWGYDNEGQSTVPDGTGPFGPPPPNTAPVAVAGGPYSVVEGSSVQLDASATTDAEQDPATLTYEWDFDGDGEYDDAAGPNPTFPPTTLEAPALVTVGLQVTDDGGLTGATSAIVTVLYNFNGFFNPIDNLPAVNSVKGGRAIPIKFSLNGDQGLGILAEGYPASQEIACDSGAPVNDLEETSTAGNSSLSYNPTRDTYTYIWKTQKSWKGVCRQLIVQLDDGSEHIAHFEFK